ncbi:hypothetical protein PAMP_021804 [Pampus punctatissimus]
MKKFSRMPKSESGGLGGASGSGSSSGVSSYLGKVFAVGRFQVTVEELIAEEQDSFYIESEQSHFPSVPFSSNTVSKRNTEKTRRNRMHLTLERMLVRCSSRSCDGYRCLCACSLRPSV